MLPEYQWKYQKCRVSSCASSYSVAEFLRTPRMFSKSYHFLRTSSKLPETFWPLEGSKIGFVVLILFGAFSRRGKKRSRKYCAQNLLKVEQRYSLKNKKCHWVSYLWYQWNYLNFIRIYANFLWYLMVKNDTKNKVFTISAMLNLQKKYCPLLS